MHQPDPQHPTPSQGEGANPAGNLPAAAGQQKLSDLENAFQLIKGNYGSAEWGTKHGLQGAALKPAALVETHPKQLLRLRKVLENALREINKAVEAQDRSPHTFADVLKNTIFSDAFITALYVSDATRAQGVKALLPYYEHVLKKFVSNGQDAIVNHLEDKDADRHAAWLTQVCHELTDLDPEALNISEFRLKAVVEYLPNLFESLANRNSPTYSLGQDWLRDRKKAKEMAGEIALIIKTGVVPNRVFDEEDEDDGPAPARPATPQAPAPAATVSTADTIPLSENGTANRSPVNTGKPGKPQIQIPTGSLLDGDPALQDVGRDDKRSSTPTRSGNTSRDPNMGVSKEWQKKFDKEKIKQADRDARLRAAGIKPDKDLRLPGQKKREDGGPGKKPGK